MTLVKVYVQLPADNVSPVDNPLPSQLIFLHYEETWV
jgi:hypothetical protein